MGNGWWMMMDDDGWWWVIDDGLYKRDLRQRHMVWNYMKESVLDAPPSPSEAWRRSLSPRLFRWIPCVRESSFCSPLPRLSREEERGSSERGPGYICVFPKPLFFRSITIYSSRAGLMIHSTTSLSDVRVCWFLVWQGHVLFAAMQRDIGLLHGER